MAESPVRVTIKRDPITKERERSLIEQTADAISNLWNQRVNPIPTTYNYAVFESQDKGMILEGAPKGTPSKVLSITCMVNYQPFLRIIPEQDTTNYSGILIQAIQGTKFSELSDPKKAITAENVIGALNKIKESVTDPFISTATFGADNSLIDRVCSHSAIQKLPGNPVRR